MAFTLPRYRAPDFTLPLFAEAPDVRLAEAPRDGVAPEGFHSTSMFPEYFKLDGVWRLAEESRMDCGVVLRPDGTLDVVENRRLRKGDRVILGRSERAEEGIWLHSDGFETENAPTGDAFAFRQGHTRETALSGDYDRLIELLRYEREHGSVVWVMGPAFAFDAGARSAMAALIAQGYCQGILAGNALATHDLEGALLHTALGQDIYSKRSVPNGHYHHLDICNSVRRCGSIPAFVREHALDDGILCACLRQNVPYVLTGSIRDDGPLPEVITDVCRGQEAMRAVLKKATTVICLATMLHTIAAGNLTPSFRVMPDGSVRPVFLYAVDASEFVVHKLRDRGSLAANGMVTNVQDFIRILAAGLGVNA